MSYSTAQKLQYGVTPAQESAGARPHVPASTHCTACFPPHRIPTDRLILQGNNGRFGVLTATVPRIECLLRAALKGRHVSFRQIGCRRVCATCTHMPCGRSEKRASNFQ